MKSNDYGIYINNKIPKLDGKIKKYYGSMNLKIKGKAFIINKDGTKEKEIKNGDKITKSGKYNIKFVNKEGKVYLIEAQLKKLNIFFLLIGVIFFLLLFLYFLKPFKDIDKQLLFDTLNYEYSFTGDRYVFDMNYGESNLKTVELNNKVSSNKKICPGTSGDFLICINTVGSNKNIKYKMQIEEEINKPKNLKFKIDNKIYDSMKDLSKDINGVISENSKRVIKVEWFWDYETLDDEYDTKDGINNQTYNFKVKMIGENTI